MFRYKSSGEIVGMMIVAVLCLSFLIWALFATVKYYKTPTEPSPPDALTLQIQACEKAGGVPFTKVQELNDYDNQVFDRCEYKPAQ